jgi:curved DNA-binding protein CbpA
MTDPYSVLQVDRCADAAVIRAAFRALARKYHPDFGGNGRRMIAVNDAWAVLGNERRRAAYDAASRSHDAQRPIVVAGHGPAGLERQPVPGRKGATGGESGSILDFGRYAGWSLDNLAHHDPEYLQWLERTQIGRPFAAEISMLLAQRAHVATAVPTSRSAKRSCR